MSELTGNMIMDGAEKCPVHGTIYYGFSCSHCASQALMREKARNRSSNYASLSAQEQWDEDKELGILDWDGK